MTASGPPADLLVLFGVTGDLAKKKILPALYPLSERGELTVSVVGVARRRWNSDRRRTQVADCVHDALKATGGVDGAALRRLLDRMCMVSGYYADPTGAGAAEHRRGARGPVDTVGLAGEGSPPRSRPVKRSAAVTAPPSSRTLVRVQAVQAGDAVRR